MPQDSPPSSLEKQPASPVRKLLWTLGLGASAWVALLYSKPLLMRSLTEPPHTAPAGIAVNPPQAASPPHAEEPPAPSAAAQLPMETQPESAPAIAAAPATPPVETPPPPPEPVVTTAPPAPAAPDTHGEAIRMLDTALQAQHAEIEQIKAQQQRMLTLLKRMHAYDRLKDALVSARPFTDELADFRAQAEGVDMTPLEPIMPFATQGIPRLDTLQTQFAEAIPSALHAPLPPEAGFMERLSANLSSFITLRRIGTVEGSAPDALIARAEANLAQGDVYRAMQEVKRLPTQAAERYAEWLSEAEIYCARDKALAQLRSAMLAGAM